MKKQGFTLVELLAVIVILALITLILTPVVTNVKIIARKASAERGADNYVNALEISVARAQMNGKLLDGSYDVDEDGNLCPCGESCTENNKVLVQVNGEKPQVGSVVVFNKGKIDNENTSLIIKNYTLIYSDEKNTYVVVGENNNDDETNKEPDSGDKVEPEVPSTPTTICRAVTSTGVTTGNVPAGNYAYGDEYICDPGDGIERVFFVLEDGDNTSFVKGDGSLHYDTASPGVGTTNPGEVSLIMNQNITNAKVTWCTTTSNNTCNANGAISYLKSLTVDNGWKVEVNLPTFVQLTAVSGGKSDSFPTWLYDYLYSTQHSVSGVLGYWTSTAGYTHNQSAWAMPYDGGIDSSYFTDAKIFGVRPVITLPKSELR